MSDDAVLKYQKDAITGHRPTWKMGTGNHPGPELGADAARDPFNVFREFGARGRRPRRPSRRAPSATPSARRCTNSVSTSAPTRPRSRRRFKMLVKRHHPDANNGDRATEDKLREIIQAYNYLKTTGACSNNGVSARLPAAAGSARPRRCRARRKSRAARRSCRSTSRTTPSTPGPNA